MAGQHIENLFRRFKGEVVDVKTISGGIYTGRVVEITNDYVCLTETSGAPGQQVFVALRAIESMAGTATDA
jgi:ferredoxin-fold anticodon binding domain-containing protein